MKGLIYSWAYCRKFFFIISFLLFLVICAAMTIIIPYADLEDTGIQAAVAIFTFVSGAACIVICGESLDKDLEDMIKTGFAEYALTGISKKGFISALLVRNLICAALSSVFGTVISALYFYLTNTPMTVFTWLIVPAFVIFIYSTDFMITPLIMKFKNSEKAGFTLGLIFGVIAFILVFISRATGFENIFKNFLRSPDLLGAAIGILLLLYIPAYFLSLRRLKRGDIC